MENQPKILVFTVSAWNSKIGANTWASLLQGYDSTKLANICIRDEVPDSLICSRYFTISENKVLKSIFKPGIKTGREIMAGSTSQEVTNDLEEHNRRYFAMKKKRRYSMLMAREFVWKLGKWRTQELDDFLEEFKPDIILHSMEGYIHLNRIINYAIRYTGAKAVGYIWDDNFSYKQSSKWGFKIYRFFQRKSLRKLAQNTIAFFAISEMTKREADAFFGIQSQVLTKPLNSEPVVKYGNLTKPYHLLYTGNLFIGRDCSLIKVVKAIETLPPNSFEIDVYTKTEISPKVRQKLNEKICRIHAPIPQKEVLAKQQEADILLFLEDIDGADAHMARLSFSTKITDYLSSGRCILAVGCADTAPMQYFISNHAAITACSDKEIVSGLKRILNDPQLLAQYARRAGETGLKNHDKKKVMNEFYRLIMDVYQRQN